MGKLFTGKGDDGTTGLLGEGRVSKANLLLEVIGTLDELNAFLGNVKCQIADKKYICCMEEIQRDLYLIMAELASTNGVGSDRISLDEKRVIYLEQQLEELGQTTIMPKGFILPGETKEAATFGLCRVVARRAERRFVELNLQKKVQNLEIGRYLNRLSSLLFLFEVKFSQKGNEYKFNYMKES
ncbi:MAG: cob(I)yrinic acid a,c-diamide adenosyltransferase [Anaerolineaceae bacterium]